MDATKGASTKADAQSKTSQINVRIDADLKRRGDASLAQSGLTPTGAVRALWELAASCADTPEAIEDALFPRRKRRERDEAAARRARRAEAIAAGSHAVEDAYRAAGLAWPPQSAALPDADLKELAYEERFGEAMGWSR